MLMSLHRQMPCETLWLQQHCCQSLRQLCSTTCLRIALKLCFACCYLTFELCFQGLVQKCFCRTGSSGSMYFWRRSRVLCPTAKGRAMKSLGICVSPGVLLRQGRAAAGSELGCRDGAPFQARFAPYSLP